MEQRKSLEAMEKHDMDTFYGNAGADRDAQGELSYDNPMHATGGDMGASMTQQRDQDMQQLRDQNLALQKQNEQLEQELRRPNTEDCGAETAPWARNGEDADETSVSRDQEVAEREGKSAELSL